MFFLLVKKKLKEMESSSIQLPYGFVHDKNLGSELHFDLHQNFKKELLLKKQPYIAHLENPAINDVVKGGKVGSLALQIFFWQQIFCKIVFKKIWI